MIFVGLRAMQRRTLCLEVFNGAPDIPHYKTRILDEYCCILTYCTRPTQATPALPTLRPLDMLRVNLLSRLSVCTRRLIVAEFPVSLDEILVSHSSCAFLSRDCSFEPTSVLLGGKSILIRCRSGPPAILSMSDSHSQVQAGS
jgi:hypothetical protein